MKIGGGFFCELHVAIGRLLQQARECRKSVERVDPEGIDFDGFADARSDDPIAELGVHPSELDASGAGEKQRVGGIDFDVVASAANMGVHDSGEDRKQFAKEIEVVSRGEIKTDGLEIPKRGVDGVVLRRAASIRKIIGKHASVDKSRKRLQSFARDFRATERQSEAGESDHGVASPIAKPVVAGDDATAIGIAGHGASHEKLIGGEHELPEPRGFVFRRSGVGLRVFFLPELEKFSFAGRLLGAELLTIERRVFVRGTNDGEALAGFEAAAKKAGE